MKRTVESFGRELLIEQDFSFPHAGCVFDTSLVLAKYFENTTKYPPGYFKDKRVLELGAGTGIIGIILALAGAHVTLSDLPELLPLMHKNIDLNASHCTDRIKTRVISWGETQVEEKYDMIVASDCIYENKELWKKFAATLQQVADKNTEIVLGHELRSQKDLEFWKYIVTIGFEFTKASQDDMDPFWRAEEIGIFNVCKKQQGDGQSTK